MNSVLGALVNGVSLGSLYSLMTLGFVVIFRATGVLNFAHGAFLLSGVFVASRVSEGAGWLVGVLVGVAVGAVLGILAEVLVMRHSKVRDHVSLTILTLGLNLLVVTEVSRRIGTLTLPLADPWGSALLEFGGVAVPQSRVAAFVLAAIGITVLLVLFRFTNWGLAMRVSNQDSEVAALMGVRLSRVSWTSWAVGGAFAVLAGLFLASFPSPGVTTTLADTAFRAFPAAVIGGLGSLTGALVGGMALGIVESFTATFQGALGVVGEGLSGIVAYLLLAVVLLVRPEGLFGKAAVSRV